MAETFVSRARRLIAEATPGEWEADEHGVVRAGPLRRYARGTGRQQLLAVMMLELSDNDTAEAMLARRAADTALIPFAVNSLPALADVVEAASQEHGGNRHEPECPICVALAALEVPHA